ncbi:MAG: hypothetical protein L0H53_08195 [Candidatus Nitrosocosmicus sp.]|nr:hypothetical protein [Candidatus Nitrosocosmicus sp.]MDN5866976.1 hypothetical protein [Candidatus Nitrosocosmicus sp.]
MDKDNPASSFVENILIILSNLPPGLRSPIIKSRLNEFLSFDTVEKREIIQNVFANYGKIENQALLNVFDSWLNSLADMKSSEINTIFYSYLIELSLNPSLISSFKQDLVASMINVLDGFPPHKKIKILDCFFESIINTPNPILILRVVPPTLIEMTNE